MVAGVAVVLGGVSSSPESVSPAAAPYGQAAAVDYWGSPSAERRCSSPTVITNTTSFTQSVTCSKMI